MVEAKILLSIESMQLITILLIIIICIFQPKRKLYQQERGDEFEAGYFGFQFKNFIILAFLFNFIYVLLNLSMLEQVELLTDKSFGEKMASIADIITATFFYYSSIKSIEKRKRNLVIILFSIGLISLTIFNSNPKYSSLPHLHSFIIYSYVSYYILTPFWNERKVKYSIFSTILLAAGFIIWTLLQLVVVLYDINSLDLKPLSMIGFTVSLLSKVSILLGLSFYSLQEVQNIANKVKDKNISLVKSQENIKKLSKLINKVSNAKDTLEHAELIVKHLTQSGIFNFQYAIFSQVDYLNRKIIYRKSYCINDKILKPDEWMPLDGIDFNNHDIIARVFHERRRKYVYGNRVLVKEPSEEVIKVDLRSPNSELNSLTFMRYKHMDIDRVFIPIFDVNERKSIFSISTDESFQPRVVAILEAGIHVSEKKGYVSGRFESEGELQLYIDNCSETYQRLYKLEIESSIKQFLERIDKDSKDNHHLYLDNIIEGLRDLTKVDGVILGLYYNNRSIEDGNIKFYFSENLSFIKKELGEVIKNFIPEVKSEKGNLKSQNRFEKLTKAQSLNVIEKVINNSIKAYWIIYSEEKTFFNEVNNFCIDMLINEMVNTFDEKRYHNATAKLVIPNNAFSNLNASIQPLVHSLQEYFETSFVTFWKNEESGLLAQKFGSIFFERHYSSFQKIIINETEIKSLINSIININSESSFYTNTPEILSFIKKEKIVTILNKAIIIDNHVLGNISIFFKSNIDPNINDLNYLDLVAIKSQINFQIYNLINSFKTISDSFTKTNLEETLQTITDQALKLLNADPVLLFKSYNGVDVYFKDCTKSNIDDFNSPITLSSFNQNELHVEIAEKILTDKSQFFSKYENYLNYANLSKQDIPNFWERESIQSMAAIRLSNQIGYIDKPVGVMFINFRHKVSFEKNSELRELIETFASFASGSIANGYVMKRNMDYLVKNLQLSSSVIEESIAQGTLHDAYKDLIIVKTLFKKLYEMTQHSNKAMYKDIDIQEKVFKLLPIILKLDEKLSRMKSYFLHRKDLVIDTSDLSKIITQTIETLSQDIHSRHLTIKDNYTTNTITIDCDKGLLTDAIYNIINNACQAFRKRGTIEISTKLYKNDSVKIEISDNGPGINQDIYPFILNPWITDKPNGSGLGLPMANYTVQRHGGELTYNSQKGKTTFTIILPLKQPKNEN
ncbi:ATP-binding protein [Cellulophaga sp. BC115SP]|uniref:ATP-binding protein n=1 Tax=Cellulophaga sp. BC115SP TaxID=2683263 RepID=UPI00141335EE|nr:ATP-binding protein [Cellulophaga sp. BC115SP]NBB31598.1 hypothetical protein [Cellulophaga sp. BC115SP]